MINFVNTGADEAILKSMSTEGCSEDLIKAMNKQGLVQKDVTVQGKNGKTFTRKQWVKASDAKGSQSTSQSSQQSVDDIKVGQMLHLKGKTFKVLKVNSDTFTVKNDQDIVTKISKQYVSDNLGKTQVVLRVINLLLNNLQVQRLRIRLTPQNLVVLLGRKSWKMHFILLQAQQLIMQ